MSNDTADRDVFVPNTKRKKECRPNPDRELCRQALKEVRKKLYAVWCNIQAAKTTNHSVPANDRVRLQDLRSQERLLSKQLRSLAPIVSIKTGLSVWPEKAFSRFRHAARAKKWYKTPTADGSHWHKK